MSKAKDGRIASDHQQFFSRGKVTKLSDVNKKQQA